MSYEKNFYIAKENLEIHKNECYFVNQKKIDISKDLQYTKNNTFVYSDSYEKVNTVFISEEGICLSTIWQKARNSSFL